MKWAGMVTAVALARANVSPWQVLWWVLCAVVVLVGSVYAARQFQLWWRGQQQKGWPTPAVALIGSGCSLLVWGLLAGWATLP